MEESEEIKKVNPIFFQALAILVVIVGVALVFFIMRGNISSLEEQISSSNSQISVLQQEIDKQDERISSLQQLLSSTRREKTDLENLFDTEAKNFRRTLADLNASLEILKKKGVAATQSPPGGGGSSTFTPFYFNWSSGS